MSVNMMVIMSIIRKGLQLTLSYHIDNKITIDTKHIHDVPCKHSSANKLNIYRNYTQEGSCQKEAILCTTTQKIRKIVCTEFAIKDKSLQKCPRI